MSSTPEIRDHSIQTQADDITEGIAKAVEFSFAKRPMIRITESEVKRRMEIAYESWRILTDEGGYTPQRAIVAVPTLLIEVIDRENNSVIPVLIDSPFETKMLPHNMSKKIQAERVLSALAKIHGTVDPKTVDLSKGD